MNETDIIESVFRRDTDTDSGVILGIGDDAAVTALPPGMQLLTATDCIIEGTHFPAGMAPDAIGHRCLAVNLSDIAAMGGTPRWASLALSLPQADEDWLRAFARGFFALADRWQVVLIGGDTVRGPLMCSVTLQGMVAPDRAVLRSGARVGDLIMVTGNPGEADTGRRLLQGAGGGDLSAGLTQRFLFPEPRVQAGLDLAGVAHAMIDVSDGLHVDLERLLFSSRCGATLNIEDLPVSVALEAVCGRTAAYDAVLSGGDDYELCFTVAPENESRVRALAAGWGFAVHSLGRVEQNPGLRWCLAGRPQPPPKSGFVHF